MVNEKNSAEKEFYLIKEGLKLNKAHIAEFLRQRVGPGNWELAESDVPVDVDGEKECIDMVFASQYGKRGNKLTYVLVDVSVPHLGIGQKYSLPAKGKAFQSERDVPANRLKKAIILIRRGSDGVKTMPARIRCPIINVQLENVIAKRSEMKSTSKKEDNPRRDKKNENVKRHQEVKVKNAVNESLTPDLLFALKEAVVHDYISTSFKRNNKYVCRGLWKWVEREIMDPNMHFFFIILSGIYQGKTGDILSRKFHSLEELTEKPEEVTESIFSRENVLVDDIKNDAERHKKAITKFLCCFSQTAPFDYLKSIFLKEFRISGESNKSRMSVFNTLKQLLERCGFEGEREVAYPLEILDELKIFREILTGDYTTLRIENASKKLKHLIPQVDWQEEDIYRLRRELAKSFSIPENEFNLNAFLPQAFYQDARIMAEQRRETVRANGERVYVRRMPVQEPASENKLNAQASADLSEKNQIDPSEDREERNRGPRRKNIQNSELKRSPRKIQMDDRQERSSASRRQEAFDEPEEIEAPQKRNTKVSGIDFEAMPVKKRKRDDESAYEAAMQAEKQFAAETSSSKSVPGYDVEDQPDSDEGEVFMSAVDYDESADDPEAAVLDDKADPESEIHGDQEEHDDHDDHEEHGDHDDHEEKTDEAFEYDLFGNKIKPIRRGVCDEASHRNFESFGGQLTDDIDSMKMAIAMSNYEIERLARAARAPKLSEEEKAALEMEAEEDFMPVKKQNSRHSHDSQRGAFPNEAAPRRYRPDGEPMRPQRYSSSNDSRNGRDNREGGRPRRPFNRDSRQNNSRNNSSRRYDNRRSSYSGRNNSRGR